VRHARPGTRSPWMAALLLAALLALAAAQPDLAPRALEPDELDAATVARLALRFELDSLVYPLLERSQVPGLVVSVAFDGAVVSAEAYGSADLAAGRALTLDDPLWLASVTKVLTATVIHDLAADGVVDLDDPLDRWLPWLHVPAAPSGAGGPVTLRHLLTHTAGFDQRLLGAMRGDLAADPPLADLVAHGLPPRVRPSGERLSYCNLCYALLGMVIEAATGGDVATAFEDRLFRPLGLASGRLRRHGDPAADAATARPHGRSPGGIAPLTMPTLADPTAGQARLSGADVGRLLAALTSAEPPRPFARGVREALLSPAHWDHRELPGWTLGMAETHVLGHEVVAHGGDLPGAHNLLAIVPGAALAIFVHVNGESDPERVVATADGMNDVRWALVEGLVGLLLGDAREPPATRAPPVGAAAAGPPPVPGPYRLATTARTSAEKLLLGTALLQVPLVREPDGAIVLRAPPALSAERRYLPVGEGLYRRDTGGDALALDRDGTGRPIVHLSLGMPATIELVPPLERLSAVASSVGAFAVLALLVLLSWPVGAFTRWRRRSPRADDAPAPVRGARWAARVVAVAGLTVIVLVGLMLAQSLATLTLDPRLLWATWGALAATAVATALLGGLTIAGAAGGTGRRATWSFHALVTLAAAALLTQALVWNLTPWS
jgi:CubicO group peptidase (beta-lactamase class C family)